ncbi:hypothetical protein U27_01567 [Candidatus Vecturithrix granuli]|uniref:HEAT repeat domain-containing protein n=1 Tax=Vecturithrix granuli TaxID=1499967 RepID=A0A081CAR1_VECG1|nr:hypothetical protein U27_01567 [Candidatus Vecturithrix granuli]
MKHIVFIWIVSVMAGGIVSSHLLAQEQVFNKPFIGTVKTLVDESGQETSFFVPIGAPDMQEYIVQQQLWKRENIETYLSLFQTEPDPDVRRHLLFELGFATAEQAEKVMNALLLLMEQESDETVRQEYLSCLSSLALHAGMSDGSILKIVNALTQRMQGDQSWNVKLHAANILVWYGQEQGLELIEQAIKNKINLQPEILYILPLTLQRLGNQKAKALLLDINMQTHDDTLKLHALWSLYQLGLSDENEVFQDAESIARSSSDVKSRLYAISALQQVVREHAELNEKITETLQHILKEEQDEHVKKHLQMLNQEKEEGCDEPL